MLYSEENNRINITAIFFAIISSVYSAYFALKYGYQIPLDQHSFRQTQTALSAFWIMRNGFSFAYETPVAGPPWSIPFEFPIYQIIVVLAAKLFNAPLDFAGRMISYLFLLLCLLPARSITKELKLPIVVFYVFVALFLSSPVYLYWGRTFMIETAALFFTISAIKYFIDLLEKSFSYRVCVFFILFMSLAILQKSTTGVPVLLVFIVMLNIHNFKKNKSIKSYLLEKKFLLKSVVLFIPLLIGVVWILYTDQIKSMNSFGMQLTSSALSSWNYGFIKQRFSSDLYADVFWKRIFVSNLAGIYGALLLIFSFFLKSIRREKNIIIFSIILGVLPLFFFTNLHIIHNYYQTANLVFFIYALAVALGAGFVPVFGVRVLIPSLILIFFSNYMVLKKDYFSMTKAVITKENRDYAIGCILKRELSQKSQFVAFGNDWSSTFAYISQRKSFTVPMWYKYYDQVATHPEDFVERDLLGAVVLCPINNPSIAGLMYWSSDKKSWKIGETNLCYISTPEKILKINNLMPVVCMGSIDSAIVEKRNGIKVVSFAGWSTMSGPGTVIPDQIFIALSRKGIKTIYLEALKVPRPEVNVRLGKLTDDDIGFSRIIPADLPFNKYDVSIIQLKGQRQEICQYQKKLILND